jgi:hypothetical protein
MGSFDVPVDAINPNQMTVYMLGVKVVPLIRTASPLMVVLRSVCPLPLCERSNNDNAARCLASWLLCI